MPSPWAGPLVNIKAAGRSMGPKNEKHAPLTVVIQVEEAVPSEDSVEGAPEGQRSHI
jgi:hypothetical protein